MTIEANPDLRDWAAKLAVYLADCEEMFGSLSKTEDRRWAAFTTIGCLFERLEELPELQGLGQLKLPTALLGFFMDVHRGRDHPWLYLGPFGGAQQPTQAEVRTHACALIAIEMLVDAAGGRRGAKSRAYETVSREMQKGGITMKPVSLRGLHAKYLKGELVCESAVKLFLSSFWTPGDIPNSRELTCPHGGRVHFCGVSGGQRCSHIQEAAAFYVQDCFKNELFSQTP